MRSFIFFCWFACFGQILTKWEKTDTNKDQTCASQCKPIKKTNKNANNVKNAKKCLTSGVFKKIFRNANSEYYTFNLLLDAISLFDDEVFEGNHYKFCPDKKVCKRHLAYLFSHMQQEVAGLSVVVEGDENIKTSCGGKTECYSGDKDQKTFYYGRGALQLSHDYNYKKFSKWYYGDECCLLRNPGKLLDDKLQFVSAIWFFSIQGNMLEDESFGETINSLNGGQECEGTKLINKTGANCRFRFLKCVIKKLRGKNEKNIDQCFTQGTNDAKDVCKSMDMCDACDECGHSKISV